MLDSKHSILIIEDNSDIREFYTHVLKKVGFQVVEVTNGQEGLDLLRNRDFHPDLIVLDLMMPVLDGWQFLAERANSPELKKTPVVVCSASWDEAPLDVPCIKKPVDSRTLMSVVKENFLVQT